MNVFSKHRNHFGYIVYYAMDKLKSKAKNKNLKKIREYDRIKRLKNECI